ncbi:C1 family peptidase [Dyadobacter chenwenxiniae]|nr:C1 family peptidase [Dyadobacter chenwenxiniae]UON86312.1 C1 family peptidase [Dyadobacter chenwenxiniae]
MKLTPYFTLLATLVCSVVIAQEQQGFGLIFDEKNFSLIPRMPEQTSATKSLGNIALRKDLLQYAPSPAAQGAIQSCVSWATAYYAYTIQYAVQHKITDRSEIDKIALSAMYPYKKLRPGCEGGMDIFEIADYMKKQGNIPFKEFSINACSGKLPSSVSPIFPIIDYQAVFDYKKDPGNKGVQAILQAIAFNDLPVIVGMEVGDVFAKLNESKNHYDPKKEGTKKYGHAMTVVGYDLPKKAFKILNSWGEKWGQQGCFWIGFEDFSRIAKAGIILILPEEVTEAKAETGGMTKVGGVFGFQYLDEKTSDFVRASPAYLSNGVYELNKKDWKVGQAFQLLTNNARNGMSMCVFSINSKGKSTVHWPRDKDFGLGTGDKLPVRGFDMVIPSPESALLIEEVGSDYLCVFYSNQTLMPHLQGILERIENGKGDIPSRIRESLGSKLMNPTSIRYEAKEMRFSAAGNEGDTVPLILKIESVK